MRLAVTNLGVTKDVTVFRPGGGFSTASEVKGGHTWLWDSIAERVNLNLASIVAISSTSPLVVAVAVQKDLMRYHTRPNAMS